MSDLEILFAPDQRQGWMLRARIRSWCTTEGIPTPYCDDIVLVASELFSNAVRATVGEARITAEVQRHPTGVLVRMANDGPGFAPEALPAPDPERGGGRGIYIAKAIGTLAVAQQQGKTIVTVLVPLKTRPPGLPRTADAVRIE